MSKAVIVVAVLAVVAVGVYAFAPRQYFSSKHPMLDQVRSNFAKIDPKYAEIPLRQGDSAYTENKEMIALCLQDPKTGEYYDMNTIMYVALHELSHVITADEYGHGKKFKENFAKLLRRAAQLQIYDPRLPIPSSYCGVKNG